MSSNVVRLCPRATDKRRRYEADARVLFIRSMRAQGLTVQQTADRCGYSTDAVELWVRGKRRVPGGALVALSVIPVRAADPVLEGAGRTGSATLPTGAKAA